MVQGDARRKRRSFMKNDVLLDLAARWEEEAKTPDIEDGSPEAAGPNAVAKGRREQLRRCADSLRKLVQILG